MILWYQSKPWSKHNAFPCYDNDPSNAALVLFYTRRGGTIQAAQIDQSQTGQYTNAHSDAYASMNAQTRWMPILRLIRSLSNEYILVKSHLH